VDDEYILRTKSMQEKCQRTKRKIEVAKQTLIELNKEKLAMTKHFDNGKENLSVVTKKGIHYMKQYEEQERKRWHNKLTSNLSSLKKCQETLQCFIDNATECCNISERTMASESIVKFLSTENNLSQKLDCFAEMIVDQDIKMLSPSQEFEMKESILEIQTKVKELSDSPNACRRLERRIFGNWILFLIYYFKHYHYFCRLKENCP
jgi:hypothetical protein